MGKLKKLKINKVKRNNHIKTKLSKQGKLKSKRHTSKKQTHKPPVPCPEKQEESDHGEDLMDMIEEDDLTFLQKAISNKSYNILKQIHLNGPDEEQKTFERKRKKTDNSQPIEELFENNISKIMKDNVGKSVRKLLPIKTKDGFVEKHIIEEENEISNDDESTSNNNEEESKENDKEDNSDIEMEVDIHNNLEKKDKNDKPVSTIELLAYREEILRSKRFKISILSSGILENPENKIGNFKMLLDFMDERKPEIYITVRKVTMLSLLEIFQDLLPLYNIKKVSEKEVKLKKEILALQNYEVTLLRIYKSYLQRLEKISKILRRKRGDTRPVKEQEVQLGEIAVSCMCELLTVHPYFNFSVNIASYVLSFLDNKRSSVRERVAQCISQIFKEDKRGELSLTIVRKLNQYIKAKKHSVYPEVITVLLSLRIKDVNLDKEKEEETKQKKLMSHKQRILALSKRERKKSKKLEQVEKELLETKAEENKQAKQKMLTEITSIVFTIYFRILKQAPNSKVLSACLEGLAKFAHCINIDFYQDLVGAIDRLIEEGNLGLREQLHCVQCIFTILSGQGTALNIDPYRFYAHLYKNLLNVHCGRTHAESEIVLKTLIQILIHQRKKITQARVIAFVKRISTWALQSQHNTTLGILGIVKQVMQLGKAAHGLLDTDCTGDGHYQSEILEPDYCNAHCTALWEIVALQRHYHSVVQQLAKNIAYAVPTSGEGSLPTEIAKLTPNELYTEYDPAGVAFKPSVPVPRNTVKKASINNNYTSNNLEQYLNAVNVDDLFVGEHVDFYKAYKSNL